MNNIISEYFHKTVKSTSRFAAVLVLLLILIYLLSGIYSISSNEIGVLCRFGRMISDNIMPGIHYALPWPIDSVTRVPVKAVHTLDIEQFFEESQTASIFSRLTGLSSYAVTGDNNIVTLNFTIQYNISKPAYYLFAVRNQELALRSMACNTVIHALAEMPIDDIITIGKGAIERSIKIKLQELLDSINAGVQVTFVELNVVRPPEIVQEFFDDVINAQIDKQQMINQAESYRNEKIPEASAAADRIISEARAYKNSVVSKAEGQTQRFLNLLEEYKKEKRLTRRRLYLDFVRDIFPNLEGKFIVSSTEKGPAATLRIKPSN